MHFSEADFEQIADKQLKELEEAILLLEKDEIEVDLMSETLTIEVSSQTPIVINRHRAAKQIWMSAMRRAWHFDYDPEQRIWKDAKSKDELVFTLEGILTSFLGSTVQLRVLK